MLTPAKQFAMAAQVPLTMSSREIALVVGATHDSVLKTVRQLVERGVVFGNETPYTHPQNADLRSVCFSSTYVGDNEQSYPQYERYRPPLRVHPQERRSPPIGHLRGWFQSESSRPSRV